MQIKRTVLAVALIAATGGAATAQTSCPKPVMKVFRNQQEVPATGAALVPQVTLQVSPNPACAEKVSYQFKDAELTLIRGRRPLLPTKRVSQSSVDLSDMMKLAQPGDRVYVFVPYKNLMVVSADGKRTPYPVPALTPEQENGIGFNWPVVQK
ncbi:hypothetical protein [Hymenobacter wooponensis]|uniref:Uncharacterized protein n=1 Tax=Hymenobacter wooponensis TaxID=1525360 RepID=A0A4Z0MSC0_9BACT|nr:hypothetical protein [Hymenobacter wooponensis]TGD82484.1 hypothetical protein EU557_01475 [Hymenobacter wooponensis]